MPNVYVVISDPDYDISAEIDSIWTTFEAADKRRSQLKPSMLSGVLGWSIEEWPLDKAVAD